MNRLLIWRASAALSLAMVVLVFAACEPEPEVEPSPSEPTVIETPAPVAPLVPVAPAQPTPAVEPPAPVLTTPPTAPAEATSPTATESAAAPATEADAPGEAEMVHVTLDEFSIDMPKKIAPGLTVFHVMNAGKATHSLAIEGQGVKERLKSSLKPKGEAELRVELKPGKYRAYCPVGNHAKRGMEVQLTVGE